MELLRGPYTTEKHVKHVLVVREPRLNRVNVDSVNHLSERPDPDKGRKKRIHEPEECDITGPITAMPLHSIRFEGVGGPSYTRMSRAERPAKRELHGTPKQAACAHSSSPSLAERHASPTTGTTPGASGRGGAVGGERVAISFGIAGLPLEESSASSTLLHVYGGGSEDSRVVPPTLGLDMIGKIFFSLVMHLTAHFPLCTHVLTCVVCFAAVIDEEETSGGGSAAQSSGEAPSRVPAPSPAVAPFFEKKTGKSIHLIKIYHWFASNIAMWNKSCKQAVLLKT